MPIANRQSRHWYALALLANHGIARQALADRALEQEINTGAA